MINFRRRFLLANSENGFSLPTAYQKVEYIESTGTQYIDTGVKPTKNYTFNTSVAITIDNANVVFWGERSYGVYSTANEQLYLNSNKAPEGRRPEIVLYSTSTTYDDQNWDSDIVPTLNQMYTLNDMTVVSTMNNAVYSITLFALNNIGVVNTSLGICRIGWWQVKDGGVEVRNMIPCYRKSDNVIGMYDLIEEKFYTNDGTGTFLKGADVG